MNREEGKMDAGSGAPVKLMKDWKVMYRNIACFGVCVIRKIGEFGKVGGPLRFHKIMGTKS